MGVANSNMPIKASDRPDAIHSLKCFKPPDGAIMPTIDLIVGFPDDTLLSSELDSVIARELEETFQGA
jgi:hypothetical protein